MKIAIPSDGKKGPEELVSEHFGKTPYFTLFDEGGKIIEFIESDARHAGGTRHPPQTLKDNNVDVLVCKGLGMNAIKMCKAFGIKIFISEADTVGKMFEEYKSGDARPATDDYACKDAKH